MFTMNSQYTAKTHYCYFGFWLWRYLLAEVVGLVFAVTGITLASYLTTTEITLVVASLYGGSVGYYGVLFAYGLMAARAAQPMQDPQTLAQSAISTVRMLLLECGSAELLDTLFFSPLLLYLCLQLLPNHQIAVVVSELTSTVAFYATVGLVHRMKKGWV
jgi:hypothetical protein